MPSTSLVSPSQDPAHAHESAERVRVLREADMQWRARIGSEATMFASCIFIILSGQFTLQEFWATFPPLSPRPEVGSGGDVVSDVRCKG